MWRSALNWIQILVGGFIYAIGLNAFLVGNHLAEGGFVGIAVLLLYKFRVPIGLTLVLVNIPLLLPGWKRFGHAFVIKTFVGVAAVSLFSFVTSQWAVPTHDPLLAALYAGVVTGLGLGLIFRAGATTGGADIIARLIRQRFKVPMGRTMFTIDVLVISLVALVIGYELAMYSLVALFVASRVVDFVIEGATTGRAVTIISDHNEKIADRIHSQMERGTTLLVAKGGYTGMDREVIYCVVPREEVNRVQRIVAEMDPKAFVVVNNVHEVLGEGFTYQAQP